MFDAAAAATAAEVNQEQVSQEQAQAAVSGDSTSETQGATDSQELLQAVTTYLPVESRQEIAFVDPTVPDYQQMIAGMGPNVEVVVLDGTRDGMEQIAESLAGRTGIDAIHLISHGDPGQLNLGTGILTQGSMTGEYVEELTTIKQSLSNVADILVYGCEFAEGQAGQDAATLLSQLTGADVAASTDATGYAELGGDWVLETQTGTIETKLAVTDDVQANWKGLLAETWMDAATGTVIGGPVGNDWYVGDEANNAPVSSAGGADIMYGAGGDDTLTSGSGNDILVGGTGNDTISGGSDDDVILGGTGNDYLDGGSAVGQNTIIGGGGNDQMVGGSGVDVFRFTGAQSGDVYTVNGGGGTDIIDLSEFSTATITNSGGVITVDRGSGNVFTINHSNVETIITAATVGNHGPLAEAGPDQTVVTSATVTLTAAGSSDQDGNTLTYQWTQIEGPKVTLSSSTAASPTFTAPSSTTTLQFVVVVSDGTTSHADTVTINVGAVNVAPTISNLSGDSLSYSEGDGAVVIDQGANALVADSDSANFDTGTLTISIPSGNVPTEDVLSIRNQGTGAGQIGVSASNVTYGGVVIGTYTGGAGGNNLVVTFNNNATPTAVTALVKNITYEDINVDAPIARALTIRFSLTDGDGGTSANYDTTVNVSGVNDAPVNVVPGAQSTNEDTTLVFSSGNGNQIAMTDPDASGGTFEVTISVTNGTLTLAGITGLTFTTGDGTTDSTMTFRGTVTDINTALNGLSYNPTANYSGSVTLTITSLDNTLVSLNIDANLQARYTFEGNANDVASGTAQNGTLMNGATYTTDATRGQVLSLDGVNDYVQITGTFSNPSEVTIGGWVNLAAGTGRREFISLSDRVHIALDDTSGVKGSIQVGASSWIDLNSNQFIAGTGWHHVMYSYSDSTNTHSLYIDGVQVATATVASSIYWTGATDTYIGRHPTNGWYPNALIDDARIYNRALSATEIAILANDQNLDDSDSIAITVTAVNDGPTDLSTGIELNTDGGNDAYLISDTGLSQSLTATTVEIRFAANNLPLETVLLSFNNPTGDELSIQLDDPSNNLELDFGSGSIVLASAIDYRAALVDGAVHTLSVTWDSTAGNWSVYIDGAHIESGTGLNVGTPLDTTNGQFVFGQEQDGQNSGYDPTQYFSGTFYDVRIWNDVRTAGEIAQYYQQQLDVTPAEAAAVGLVANWQMDGLNGSNQVVELVSGNNLSIAHASGTGFTTGAVSAQLAIEENSANGSHVGFVTTEDSDAGETFSYSLTDSAGGRFAVNAATGEITVADGTLLDYDTASSHTITVRVTDSGGLTYDETFTINLTNVNETPTDLSLSANTVAENAANGTVVGTVSGTDPDSGDTKTYSFTDSAGGRFAINSSTGQITVADGSLLNYESATSHTVTVRVTDAGGLTYDETFTINLTNINEGPTFSNLNGAPTYVEGGAAVVLDSDVQITDPELSSANNFNGATLTLQRQGGASSQDMFSATGTLSPLIDEGALVVNGIIIGGVLQNANGTLILLFGPNATGALVNQAMQQIAYSNSSEAPPTSVQVNWTFSDGNSGTQGAGGAATAVGNVTVSITAVNDAPTDLSISADTVAENAANGTVVGTVSGTDPDSGDTKTYSLTDSAGGRFTIDSSTGVITVADGSLLDYESATSHTITVRVTDAGGLTYDETFTINLTNVNEAPTGADVTVTINEDSSHILTTANFGFSDVDAGDSLSAVRIDTLPGAGTLTLSGGNVTAGQVITVADITAGNLVFTPAQDTNGTGYASFTFSVRDSTNAYDAAPNALIFDVTAVNDAPIRTAGTVSNLTVAEDAGLVSLGLGSVTYSPGGGADESGQTLTYAVTALPSGTIGNVYLADGTTLVTLSAYTLAEIQGMQFKPTANASGVTAFQFNVYDSGGTANGGTNTISQFILITVNAVNDAPTITTLSGDSLSYSEGDGAVVIEQGANAVVADVDSTNLDTGTLTVSIPSGGDSTEDVLSIRNQGTGAGQIGVSGSTIMYGGTPIGTFTGGSSGSNLVITLNSNATPTAVTALVQNITYENTDTAAPTTGARTVRYVLTDGDGGTSANYDTTVTVSGVNDAPVITPIAPDVTFVEGGLPQVIDATGTITDVDSTNFDGGVMTVSSSANGSADDRLSVGNWGTGPGQVGVSGSDVTYGGTVIGTVSGGTSGSDPLVITFNTSATPSAVQEVYRSIQFNNVSDNPSTATRTLTIGLTDGDGGTATPQTKLVYVQGANDPPVLTFGQGDKNFTEGALAVMIDALPNVSDLDSTNFDTGTLTITISANPSVDDRVELLNTGMGAGQIGVSGTNVYYGGTLVGTQAGGIGSVPFVVTFNANADAAIVGEVMANIRFWVAGDAPSTATRTIEAVLTDGDGGTSLTASKQITVTAVNDPTVVTGGTSGSGNEDTIITNTLTATDAEGLSDGTVFTVSANATNGTASIDPATGLWSYTPNADYNGSDSFTVTITDDAGNTTTQVISVTVTPVVDITDDNLTTTEDTAISANVLTGTNGATADSFEGTPVLTSVTQGANGSVTFLANGTVTYTPNANFNGTDSFTYTITSGGVTETATVTVTVTAVDDPTVVTGGTSGTGNEDTTLIGTLTATDVDGLSDGSVFTVSANATNGTASIDPATGLWSYTPNADFNGSDSFTVTITDDAGNTTTQVISVTVTPVNDAPLLATNTGSTVAEGGTDTISSSELAVTDIEQAAAQLSYSIGAGPLYGRLELTTVPGILAATFTQDDIAANRLIYIHDGSETTSDSFTFTVNDGAGGSLGPTTVTLTITPVNDAPTISSDGGGAIASLNVAENVSAVTIVTGADVDLPAQALSYSISGGIDQASFTINAVTGALSFTAPPDFEVATDANGDNVYVVQVQVVDSQGASTTQTIQVTVTDVVESVAPPPVVPPILLTPIPPSSSGGPTSGPGASPADEPATVSDPTTVPPGPTVPPMVGPPVNVVPLTLVPPSDRPVERVPEEPRKTEEDAKDRPLFLVNDDQGRPLYSVLPVAPAPTLEPEPPETTPSVSDLLMAKLDEMAVSLEQAVSQSQERHELMARVAAVTGTTLSVGFVAWALRSGAILASMLATMPAWQHFDPLPVVKLTRNERKHRRDEATRAQQQEAAEFKGLNQVLDKTPALKRTA
jgi:hypothetical protein